MKKFQFSLCFVVIFLINFDKSLCKSIKDTEDDNPVVCYNDGCVRGKTFEGYRKPFEGFLGIPYAKPPVGNLRLRNPVPIGKWKGILNATDEKMFCIQKNFLLPQPTIQGFEDCLYLYVYRPKNVRLLNRLLPVMVYIHGGAFFAGVAGPSTSGADYFIDSGDVIMVTVQYRLGPLGFLSTGDDEMPGNFGLKDQALALKWVHDNIAQFGGNPSLVTVFGQSAGAVSAHLHMMSPLSQNLFHRAILLSGSAIASFAYVLKNPLEQAKQYAEAAGMTLNGPTSTAELAEKFRNISAKDILNASEKLKYWSLDPLTINRPVVENCKWDKNRETTGFLCKDPVEMWRNGEYAKMPMMASLVPQEGAVRALGILANENDLSDLNSRFDELIPKLMELDSGNLTINNYIAQRIKERYFSNVVDITKDNYQNLFDIYTDRAFMAPLYQTVDQHLQQPDSRKYPFYLFKFSFPGLKSYSYFFSGSTQDFGVVHCDDLIYLLKSPALFPNDFPLNSTEARMRSILVNYLTSFAYYGNPIRPLADQKSCESSSSSSSVEFSTSVSEKCYINFTRENKNSTEIQFESINHLDYDIVKFWKDLEKLSQSKRQKPTRSPQVIPVIQKD